ncbi:recombinase RecT [[Clostridium] fimetarium]|uniref:Recombination protein RecT n=1 Tax=[Clostridium] fimetarium TaxID=99656 RepID=A0A1I0Q0G1_9FIRM|nr:recombinase RecT [[Clostridium] fimetarium]SEW20344.1 recombination protein RecT [[Clostridium] fimetarium]
METIDIKQELASQAQTDSKKEVKLTKAMSIAEMIKAMMPEIKRALPSMITPERFTRIALSALNNTPELQACTPMSFISALLNAAQLGLEINSPLGHAYLIPYKNKGVLECQFQIGYLGLIALAYRNELMQTIQAQCVYENDEFLYEYGLNPKLVHRPATSDRGEPVFFYGLFKMINSGFGFCVMSKQEMDEFARTYSKGLASSFSPWKTSYNEMAKKTVIKQALKYAPIKTDFQKALSTDESIKYAISEDMTEAVNEIVSQNTEVA